MGNGDSEDEGKKPKRDILDTSFTDAMAVSNAPPGEESRPIDDEQPGYAIAEEDEEVAVGGEPEIEEDEVEALEDDVDVLNQRDVAQVTGERSDPTALEPLVAESLSDVAVEEAPFTSDTSNMASYGTQQGEDLAPEDGEGFDGASESFFKTPPGSMQPGTPLEEVSDDEEGGEAIMAFEKLVADAEEELAGMGYDPREELAPTEEADPINEHVIADPDIPSKPSKLKYVMGCALIGITALGVVAGIHYFSDRNDSIPIEHDTELVDKQTHITQEQDLDAIAEDDPFQSFDDEDEITATLTTGDEATYTPESLDDFLDAQDALSKVDPYTPPGDEPIVEDEVIEIDPEDVSLKNYLDKTYNDTWVVEKGDTISKIVMAWSGEGWLHPKTQRLFDYLVEKHELEVVEVEEPYKLHVTIHTGDTFIKPNMVSHTVQSGETAWSIAKQYDITIEDLTEQNGLEIIEVKDRPFTRHVHIEPEQELIFLSDKPLEQEATPLTGDALMLNGLFDEYLQYLEEAPEYNNPYFEDIENEMLEERIKGLSRFQEETGETLPRSIDEEQRLDYGVRLVLDSEERENKTFWQIANKASVAEYKLRDKLKEVCEGDTYQTFKARDLDQKCLEIYEQYESLREEGYKAKDAAETLGFFHDRHARTIFRYVSKARELKRDPVARIGEDLELSMVPVEVEIEEAPNQDYRPISELDEVA